MIVPNKLICFQDSILAKIVIILDEVSFEDKNVIELYEKVKSKFEDINQYILTLDVLFTLEKITYDEKEKVIRYVKTDIL